MGDTHHDALSIANNASIGGNLSVTGDLDVDGSFDLAGGLSLTDDDKLQIRDANIYINSSADGQLDIDADGEVEITAPTTHIVSSTKVDIDGGEIDIDAGAGKAVGINIADQTTDDTAGGAITIAAGKGKGTGDGGAISLTAGEPQATSGTGDGGSVSITAGDAVSGDKDGGNVTITAGTKSGSGADGQIKLQDDILLNGTEELRFQDSGTKIYSSADGQLDIDSDSEVEISGGTNVDIDAGTGTVTANTATGATETASGGITLQTGAGGASGGGGVGGAGGGIALTGGNGGAGDGANAGGAGADVTLTAGSGGADGGGGAGADGQVKIQSDVLMNSTEEIRFQDADTKVYSSTDGQLDVDGDVEVEITAPTTHIVATTKVDIDGGDVDIDAGAGKAVTINITAQGTNDTAGGSVTIEAGKGKGTGDGGSVNITAAEPQASSGTGDGGDVNITAADAVAGDKDGGDIVLTVGLGSGTGDDGQVKIEGCTLIDTSEELRFRDADIAIYSSGDGQLDIKADDVVAIDGDTDVTGILSIDGSLELAQAMYCDDMWYGAAAFSGIPSIEDIWADSSNAGSIAAVAVINGVLRLATGATGSQDAEMSMTNVTFDNDGNPMFEARIKMSNITNTTMRVGFVAEVPGVNDYILFLFDTGVDAANIYLSTENNNGGEVQQDTGVNLTAGTYFTLRIELCDDDTFEVYINDTQVCETPTGTIRDVPWTVYFYVDNKAAAEDKHLDIDYVKIFQDRMA